MHALLTQLGGAALFAGIKVAATGPGPDKRALSRCGFPE